MLTCCYRGVPTRRHGLSEQKCISCTRGRRPSILHKNVCHTRVALWMSLAQRMIQYSPHLRQLHISARQGDLREHVWHRCRIETGGRGRPATKMSGCSEQSISWATYLADLRVRGMKTASVEEYAQAGMTQRYSKHGDGRRRKRDGSDNRRSQPECQ